MSFSAFAGEAYTSDSGQTSSGVTSSIQVRVNPAIRFYISSAHIDNGLSVSTSVNSTTTTVTAKSTADQIFKDESVGATYYGYYLSTGVSSANQSTSNIAVKVRRGVGETPGRSYYVTGNGKSKPVKETDLNAATPSYTTFANSPSNSSHCGPHFKSNAKEIRCEAGTPIPNMDLTQFVKVMDNDKNVSSIVSQLEFTAIPE